MPAQSLAHGGDILKLVLNGTPITGIADNAGTGTLTSLYVALHTADPGTGGSQTTNEAAYTSYARVAIARNNSSPAWTVTSNSASPAAIITFPYGTGGSGTATHFSVGTAASGTGRVIYYGTLSPTVVMGNGIAPQIGTASTITET